MRKYIGPQSYCNWPDVAARTKMEQAVKDIQAKADLIYNKFKSHFAFQVIQALQAAALTFAVSGGRQDLLGAV